MSELPWLCSLVKHNVAAKHGNSKPLTSDELWLLELRIKSTRILAPIPDALWDMCKLSILEYVSSQIFEENRPILQNLIADHKKCIFQLKKNSRLFCNNISRKWPCQIICIFLVMFADYVKHGYQFCK